VRSITSIAPTVHAAVFRALDQSRHCRKCDEAERVAEQHFKDALRLAPSSPDSYIYYARYLLSHSRADEARAFLRSALELSPTDLTARELLTQVEHTQAERQSLISL